MLSRDLLRDAVRLWGEDKPGAKFRVTHMSPDTIQRRVRVGFVTAAQLAQALADAGVIGPLGPRGRRQVLAYDLDAAHALVDQAIDDGRITLDVTGSAPDVIEGGGDQPC